MSAPRPRDPWLDTAKMALVTLVVVGHAWALVPKDELNSQVYDFLYAWHMPAFIFVTGYLSRSFDYSPGRLWRLVRTVAIPYVVFECLIALFRIHVGGESLADLWTDPHWPLWFLPALFAWRLVTPLFRSLPGGLLVAVALGATAGMWAGDLLDLTRMVGFLPFFVLGLKTTPERLELLRTVPARAAAVGVLAMVWLLAGHTDRWAKTEWLYYASTFEELQVTDARGVVTQLTLLGIGAAASLAFLALLPRRGGLVARMGGASLVVYLVHGFFVRGAGYAGVGTWLEDEPRLALVVTALGGIAVAALLAAPPVARVLQDIVDPFGMAERRVREAVDLTVVAATPDPAGALGQDSVGAGTSATRGR